MRLLFLKQIQKGMVIKMRKVYLDHIRWAVVVLVLVYHVFYMFNGVGIPGGIPGAKNIPLFDTAACVIYPWFMALLFLIAGMSARYSLQKRTEGQFIRERTVRLLVPSTLGLFCVHWVTGYLNIKMGGGLAYIPAALIYPISVLSGIGPLWFIQMLFLFSCILILLRKADKEDIVWTLCGKVRWPAVLFLFLLIFASAQILNMPVLTMYRFGIYFTSFLTGYYIFSHEKVQDIAEKRCIPMLCFSVTGAILYAFRYGGSDYTSAACLQSIETNLYLWIVILAIVGCGRRYFNRETAFTRHMAESGYGIYILHYPVLIAVGYILHYYFDFPAVWNYLLALMAGGTITLVLYEAVKRIPVLRYFILGIKKAETFQ